MTTQQQKIYSVFANKYVNMLISIYDNIQFVKFTKKDKLLIMVFSFGNNGKTINDLTLERNNAILQRIIGKNINFKKRTLRYYNLNTIYIIKPLKAPYWSKRESTREAMKTFTDLLKMGY